MLFQQPMWLSPYKLTGYQHLGGLQTFSFCCYFELVLQC